MLGTTELVVILTIALLLFGPEKLPEMARQLGETINQLRDTIEGRELKG